MNRADACSKFRVGARPCRRRALAPRIVAAGGDGQHPAHRGNCVHGLIRVHELERRDGTEPVSVANQAAAFDSISRSSRSTRFSRRNRLSSSRSAVVSPSLRRPSSSPACLTHLRIALAEASNSRANCAIGRPVRANSMIRRRYSGAYGGWVLGIGASFFLSPQHRLRKRVNSSQRVVDCGPGARTDRVPVWSALSRGPRLAPPAPAGLELPATYRASTGARRGGDPVLEAVPLAAA